MYKIACFSTFIVRMKYVVESWTSFQNKFSLRGAKYRVYLIRVLLCVTNKERHDFRSTSLSRSSNVKEYTRAVDGTIKTDGGDAHRPRLEITCKSGPASYSWRATYQHLDLITYLNMIMPFATVKNTLVSLKSVFIENGNFTQINHKIIPLLCGPCYESNFLVDEKLVA